MNPLHSKNSSLIKDENGVVVTSEVILVGVIAAFGLAVAFSSLRDTVVAELSDSAGSVQDLNQGFIVNGIGGASSTVAGSDFLDQGDVADSPDDIAGEADNDIRFYVLPRDEGQLPVINAGFDEGNDPDLALRTFGRGPLHAYLFDADDIAGWQTTAGDNIIEVWDSGFGGVDSQAGDYFAEINANSSAQLFQEFTVTPGSTIEYSVWHRGRTGVDVANVLIGPAGSQTLQQTMTTGTAWVNYTGLYTVPAGVTVLRIGFESVSSSNGNSSFGNFIDSLEVTVQ